MTDQQQRHVQIAYLADHPEHIDTLAVWHHRTWSYLSPASTVADRIEHLRAAAVKGRLPETFVALQGDAPAGCASLIASDMPDRKQLSPWLASVFVVPDLRNAGIGSRLVAFAMREAQALGAEALYLYTPDRQSFYARLGWKERETRAYRGFQMTVMEHDLSTIPGT